MPHPHGTINRYNNQRCRCDACRSAIRDYRRARRSRDKRQVQRADLPPPIAVPYADPETFIVVAAPKPAGSFQLVQASCGHLLWFPSHVKIPLGRWVHCPRHGRTGVRTCDRVSHVPTDAVRGEQIPRG